MHTFFRFRFQFRGTVIAITMASASLTCFLQVLFFKPVATSIGVEVSFFFFGAVCLAAAFYALLVVPETRNRTLEDIHRDLKTKKEREADMVEDVGVLECIDVSKSNTSLKNDVKSVERI